MNSQFARARHILFAVIDKDALLGLALRQIESTAKEGGGRFA